MSSLHEDTHKPLTHNRSDTPGLIESVAEYLPEARWQRCMVHFYRNVFSHVPPTKVRDVSHMLKAIHAQESREAAERKAKAIIEDLRTGKMNKAAELVEQAVHETLTYYAFPDIHWQKFGPTIRWSAS